MSKNLLRRTLAGSLSGFLAVAFLLAVASPARLDGFTIANLLPPGAHAGNLNLLTCPGTPHLTRKGLSFPLADAKYGNILLTNAIGFTTAASVEGGIGAFALTPLAAPKPGTILLLSADLLLLFALLRAMRRSPPL